MRRYRIEITDSKGNAIVDNTGVAIGPYDSNDNPQGAMHITFDAYCTTQDVSNSGTMLAIFGLPLSILSQSVNLWGAKVRLYGGFSGGLPLENAEQYGLLIAGNVFNPYGNWQGTHQSLNLILSPGELLNDSGGPFSITMNGKQGEKLSDVLFRSLSAAFPNRKVRIDISQNLVLPEPWADTYTRIGPLAAMLKSNSHFIQRDRDYAGVRLVLQQDEVRIYDGTVPGVDTEIKAEELIGQPTWLSTNTISFKTPMRADITLSDTVTLPINLFSGPESVLSVSSPQAFGAVRNTVNFTGKFLINSVRHVGAYRDASADAWVTIYEAIAQ
ncbi:hypothetical protein [Citrobacter werkmanii]|uniref:hypothetical protein n=1 Tax=Citrobacter werkmanii TaxID=67827 RepID=UPI00300CB76F